MVLRLPLQALLGRELFSDAAGINGQTVVVQNAAQFDDLFRGQIELEQAGQLRVAVLLNDVNAFMRSDKVMDLMRERIGANAQVIHVEIVLILNLIEALAEGKVSAPICDEADLRGSVLDNHGRRNELSDISNSVRASMMPRAA